MGAPLPTLIGCPPDDGECCPDAFGQGFIGPGSIATMTADELGPPESVPTFLGPMAFRGPQIDVLITNTLDPGERSIAVQAEVEVGANALGAIEPGAQVHLSQFVAVWPKNTPPSPLVFPGPGTNIAIFSADRSGDAAPGPTQFLSSGSQNTQGPLPISIAPPGFPGPLAPGEFQWVSTILLVRAVGLTGPTFVVFAGETVTLRGWKI